MSNVLTRDGQAGMTAAFKAISGSLAAPGISFTSDATSGLYLSTTGIVGMVSHSLGMLLNTENFSATAATVQAGGSNYAVGDTITTTGGTAITQPVLTVATLSGTAVATVTVTYPGFYTVKPSNPVSQGSTSGLGSGATFNVTYNDPTSSDYRAIFTDQDGALLWQKLGASSFVSSIMSSANGLDFVTALGATNVNTATGLSAPPPGSSFKNLSIKVATNTTVAVAADFVVTTNGTRYQTTALSATINMATTGANALDTGSIAVNTFYAIWAIAKPDGTTAGLASASFTNPTMPAGYTYKARFGAVQTINASATLYGTWQLGRTVQYVVGLAQTANYPIMDTGAKGNGNAGGMATIALARYTPTTASRIKGSLCNSNNVQACGAGPNNNYSAFNSLTNPPPCVNFSPATGQTANTPFDFLLESTNIYWFSNGASGAIVVTGWEDNL